MKNKYLLFILLFAFAGMQIVNAQSAEPLNSSYVNFTPQFFICIIAGVILAMGFQVVLTILSVASGVSLIGNLEKPTLSKSTSTSTKPAIDNKPSTPLLVKITSAAGIWTIITASVSLFFASLLAVKLSLVSNDMVGITLGLVIWAAFFMLMMYLEIKSVSSLLGMVFNTALQGLRYSFGSLQKVFGSSPEARIAKIAENTIHDFGKELTHALGDNKLVKKFDKYVKELKPKELDYDKIKGELFKLFKELEIEEKIDKSDINISEKHLYKIAESHTPKSKKLNINWAQLLIEAWGIYKIAGPVSDKISSTLSMTSNGDEPGIKAKIEKYLFETGKEEFSPERLKTDFFRILHEPALAKELIAEKVQGLDRSTFVNILSKRTDVAPDQLHFMADSVSGAYEFVKQKISENSKSDLREDSKKTKILGKIEDKFRNYVSSASKDSIDYDQVKSDFIAIFHNPKATFSVLKNQLSTYDRESLIAMLSTRENISSEESEKLVVKIEEARNYVLSKIEKVESEIKSKAEQAKVIAFHEAEIIRKSAATAAWWLFATAIVSGLAASAGGMLAIG